MKLTKSHGKNRGFVTGGIFTGLSGGERLADVEARMKIKGAYEKGGQDKARNHYLLAKLRDKV